MRRLTLILSVHIISFVPVICQSPVANFPVKDCGVTKQCVGAPDTGCISQGICTQLIKYSYDRLFPDEVSVDLYGLPHVMQSPNFWIAVGFNHKPVMAGTLVTECVYNGGKVEIFSSYNQDDGYINRRLENPKDGFSNASSSLPENQILRCSFQLDRVRQYKGKEFDLAKPLYVILGDGPALQWDIRTHPTTPFVSSEPVTFASANQASAAYPNLRSLLTIAPTVAGKSGETGNDAVMATSPVAHEVPPAITGCAMTKGCLATPADCLDKKTCQAVVSYMVDPDRSGQMKFELWRRTASNGHQYVAVGFGPVSPTMANSAVLGCVNHGGKLDVLASYNPDNYNIAVLDAKENITVHNAATDGQRMYCQFSLPARRSFRGTFAASPVNLNLNSQTFLMLAYGPASPNGRLLKHSILPLTTASPVLLTSLDAARFSNVNDLYKSHAGLMVGAWMFLASIGILTARYYKTMWLSYQPYGLKMWFHIHRPVMLLAVMASIAGFVIIFVARNGLWTSTPASQNPHPIIGIIAFILALIQPVMAFFRPNPGAKNRPLFNWSHFTVGFMAHILAIAAIFLGLLMPQMNVSIASIWIMIAFSAFHTLWLIVLQVVDWIAPRLKKKQQATMQLKHINGNGMAVQESVTTTPPKRPASTLKTVLWIIYVIVVTGLTVAILVLIGIS